MKLTNHNTKTLFITEVKGLDPIYVYTQDCGPGRGNITITCYGKAWTNYWGSMGKDNNIEKFFCSCDEYYLANKLSDIDSTVYDLEEILARAEKDGAECFRDDPWNDYEFMEKMCGPDMGEWPDCLPKKQNHEYGYLLRIIKAVQEAFREQAMGQPQTKGTDQHEKLT